MNRELYIMSIAAIALLVYGCNSMALKSEDPKERMAAVQQIDDQDDLLDIALNEEYNDDVRLAATAKMEKPHALWRVWCFSTNKADIAAKALSRISDNDYLARIAMLAPYEESKEEIEAREKKEKILTGLGVAANIGGSLLAEKTGHAEVASAGAAAGALAAADAAPESLVLASYADFQTNQAVLAVEKITAGEKLGEIAANSVSRPVQLTALRRYMPFADANKRAEVAMSGALYKAKIRSYSAKDARKNVSTAVREINDPSLLKRIAANSSTIMIGRRMAFARLVQMREYNVAGRVMWLCVLKDRDVQAVLPNVDDVDTLAAILCDNDAASVLSKIKVDSLPGKSEELLLAAARKIDTVALLRQISENCTIESVRADTLRRYIKLKPFGHSGISLFDESKPLDVRKKAISDNVADINSDIVKELFNASTNLLSETRDDCLELLKVAINTKPDMHLKFLGEGLICAAAEAQTPRREEYLELFKIAAIGEVHPGMDAAYYAFESLPIEARKLAFSFIPSELDDESYDIIAEKFSDLIVSAKHGNTKNDVGAKKRALADEKGIVMPKNEDDAIFLSWALANVENVRILCRLLLWPGKDPDKGLTETDYKTVVDRFAELANDNYIMYLLKQSKVKPDPYLVEKISAKNQAVGDYILAAYSPVSDIQKAVEALSRCYAADQKKAYDAVFKWFSDNYDYRKKTFKNEEDWGKRMSAITDIKLLYGLYCAAKYDAENTQRSGSRDVAPLLYAAIFNNLKTRVDEMDKGKLDNFVSDMIGQSKGIEASKKAVVIGNYYVGMPVLGFIALNKTQDTKALPMEWKMDDEGKDIIISKMAFDSKNIFKAIGLERSEVTMKLPSKLGVPRFEVNMTKTKISRNTSKMNEIAEYLGDYSDSYKVSGGDVYYQSDSEAKSVRLTYWEKACRLDIEML